MEGVLGMVIIFRGIAAAQQSSPFTEARPSLGGRIIICCFLGESLWLAGHPSPELPDSSNKAPRSLQLWEQLKEARAAQLSGAVMPHSYLPGSFMRINCFTVIRERGQFVSAENSHSSSYSLGLLAVSFSYIKPVILGLLMLFITDTGVVTSTREGCRCEILCASPSTSSDRNRWHEDQQKRV